MSENYDVIVRNIDSSIANAIRRTIISKIPTIAIDDVQIFKNDSDLDDEIIAHRMGQIPIRKINDTDVQIYLKKRGPGMVYSGDIKGDVIMVDKNIVLVELKDDEELEICGTTREGIGEEHAKFSVSCGTSYKKIDDKTFKFHVECLYDAKKMWNESIKIIKEDLNKFKI